MINLISLTLLTLAYFIGWLAHDYKQVPVPKTVEARMKQIQTELGCKTIDGLVGAETTPLLNAKVRQEKKQRHTEHAERYMTESGAPK